jgi:hypothetical protein
MSASPSTTVTRLVTSRADNVLAEDLTRLLEHLVADG